MKNGIPYKGRLYALIGVILNLCFSLSVIGVTALNEKAIQKDMQSRLTKLEKSSKRKLDTIASSYLTEEESTYLAALELSQLYDTVEQNDIGLYYECKEEQKTVLKRGSTVFFHYYDSFQDEDGDTVYEETQQEMLLLDSYLTKQEITEIREIYEENEDAVVIANGTVDGLFLIPEQIQVIAPTANAKGKKWESKEKNKVLNDQGIEDYVQLYEKTLKPTKSGTKKSPTNVTVSSEAYFTDQQTLVSDQKKGKNHNFFQVTFAGTVKTGKTTAVKYYFSGKPLKKAVQQLWFIYLVLILFYILAASIVYVVMHLIFAKQENWNWNQKMLTRAIAHELKTPISIIQGYCEGLRYQEDKQRQQEYLETITQETAEMNQLVLDMLELSRMETEGYELDREEIQLVEFVQAIAKQYESFYNEKDITLELEGLKGCFINGDLACMHKVISNLLGNAIKHAPEHGIVRINIQEEKEKIYLSFYNNGPEIPEALRKHIWDGYQKVQREDKSRIRSTGLGLTIVKYMLDLHGFKYGCENKTPGVEFWVSMDRSKCGKK